MQRGLEADLCFLHGHHGFFQADRWVFQLHFFLQMGGMVLRGADRAQRAFQFGAEAVALGLGLLQRLGQAGGQVAGGRDG